MHAMAGDGTQVGARSLVAGAPGEDCRGNRSPVTAAGWRSMVLTLAVMCCVTTATPRLGRTAAVPAGNDDLLDKAEIPAAWRTQFWASPSGRALLRIDPKQVADLVPVQSGLRFCRCPACGAEERDEPLLWSLEQPKALKCRRCGVIVPSDKYPAKANGKEVPEETVEVLPGVIHHYPYHAVEESKARYPDERLFLQARIDYEARKYLAKAALYAAAESRASPPAAREPRLAVLACAIVLRFAQVYPAYATHFDQPGCPKYIQPARLQPPYRRAYQTGKWEWTGSLEVPINLVMAYALIRDDPAWAEAGKLLDDPAPRMTVERDLFRASAEFARVQPEEFSEDALHVYRGMVAVGRLVNDPALLAEARSRLDGFLRRGFYHDGFWRQAEVQAHRRVLELLDGWVGIMLAGEPDASRSMPANSSATVPHPSRAGSVAAGIPLIGLARAASATIGPRLANDQIQRAIWSGVAAPVVNRRPVLLGGAGLARLAVGRSATALDLEVRGLDSYSGPHFQRLAMRLSAAGVPILDDLDECGATATGWELATASHNTVVVDGLNQRETPLMAGKPAAGSDFLFFAADPDFQVVSADDRRAYPRSASRYRQTLVVTASNRSCYAVSVFEVEGGLQHDQLFHAAPGRNDRWALTVPAYRPPPSLLPSSITFLPSARPEQGRWFVQSYGEFRLETQASLTGPSLVVLAGSGLPAGTVTAPGTSNVQGTDLPPSVRLHLLGDTPMAVFTAVSPDPTRADKKNLRAGEEPWRASLILRRTAQGQSLSSRFVTVFEPVGKAFQPLRRVGRVSASPEVVVLRVETIDGLEYVLVNLKPETTRRVQLPGGRFVSFDGLALRVREHGLVLAGGTFAEGSGRLVSQASLAGTLTASVRKSNERGLGWFLTPDRLADDPAVAGRTLIIQHGDGSSRSWTLDSLESTPEGTRLHVREEPGFTIDPHDRSARYYQFPQVTVPGPHRFHLAQIVR
ncbi:MAG: hypothetical protein JO344_10700 [Planctomycetaceae bacterium]|nr:hypothetical protein [Planctomycetaceae bacterium]